MAETSLIEWTDATFNPWIGCTKISPACDNCYASVSTPSRRFGVEWGTGKARRRTAPGNWALPLRWNHQDGIKLNAWQGFKDQYPGLTDAEMKDRGFVKPRRRRVFCASLADVFDTEVDPAWRADLFRLIEDTPNLDWLLLTKRIGNVPKLAPVSWLGGPIQHGPDPTNIHGGWPSNVWLGATICNQAEADRDIPKLLAVPAAVRFLSMEPLLGPVNLRGPHVRDRIGIDWVIVGGESGPHARPMQAEWVIDLRDQCANANIPFLFKQWGEWVPALAGTWFHPLHGMPQFIPRAGGRDTYLFDGDGSGAVRIGKKAAGRLLDGRHWDGYPEARA